IGGGDIVERQGNRGRTGAVDGVARLVLFCVLYGFRFAAIRCFRRATKPMTSDGKRVLIEGRFFIAPDRHASLRLRRSLNSARSSSAKRMRGFLLPRPTLM